jgi:chemotaxis protein CheX
MQASSVSDYIKKAVEEVIGTYLAKTPVLKDTKVKKENAELKDISVIIGLASEKLEGVFIVSYDKRIIFDFMKNVLGENVEEINKDVIDAGGELTNQICGVFRREFEKTGITLQASTPSIVTGKDHKIEIPSKIPRMVFLYQIDGNKDLMIEFGLVKK